MTLDIRLLGVAELWTGGRRVDIGPAKQRAVFAILAAEAGNVVPTERLEQRTWGDAPPKDARRTLHVYLTRLRRAIAGIDGLGLRRHGGGYVLSVDTEHVDLHRFRRLCAAARDSRDVTHAAALWQEAFALWRGEPFTGHDIPWLNRLRHELNAEHEIAELDRNDAYLRAGRHTELLAGLTERAAQHPWDERLAAQLIEAAHGCGRTADALAHYREFRQRLVERLGREPGPALQELHRRILDDDHAPTPTAPLVPRQLPVVTPSFTGRDAESAHAVALLGSGTAIVSIDGMAGVGKTAFAVRVATAVSDKFADGQLFVDLRGFSDDLAPLPATEALGGMLRDLGVPEKQLPGDLAGRSALLRSHLAQRRVLLLLDNAADVEQVVPMLPGGGDSAVLITSRRKLSELPDVEPITLDVLPHEAARELFTTVARRDVEITATDDVVELTGRLPLALRLAAARLRSRNAWTVTDLRDRLESEREGAHRSLVSQRLGAAFDLSLRDLSPGDRELFLLASLIPAHDITASVVSAVTGRGRDEVEETLEELCDLNLLTTSAAGRYRYFDLLRDYAGRAAEANLPDKIRREVTRRALHWYVLSARAACEAARIPFLKHSQLTPDTAAETFDAPEPALAWLDAERGNLLTALRSNASSPLPLWMLVDSIANYLLFRAEGAGLLEICDIALREAEAAGDGKAQLRMLTRKASAAQSLGDRVAMQTHAQAARELVTPDEPILRLGALAQLIIAHRGLGNVPDAAQAAEEALEIYRQLDGPGQYILQQAAGAVFDTGDLAATRELLQEARLVFRQRDRLNLGFALTALVEVCSEQGDFDAAAGFASEAGEWIGKAGTNVSRPQLHQDIAMFHHARGETGPALRHAHRAVELVNELGMRDTEGAALATLAQVSSGISADAPRHAAEAVRLSRELAAVADHIVALRVQAGVRLASADVAAATTAAESALELARAHGYRLLEAKALTVLTEIQLESGDDVAARRNGSRALREHRRCGARPQQAKVHALLARAYATVDMAASREHDRAAARLREEMGIAAR